MPNWPTLQSHVGCHPLPMADVNIYNAYMLYMQRLQCMKPIPVHTTVHVDAYIMLVWQPTSLSGPRVGGVSTHPLPQASGCTFSSPSSQLGLRDWDSESLHQASGTEKRFWHYSVIQSFCISNPNLKNGDFGRLFPLYILIHRMDLTIVSLVGITTRRAETIVWYYELMTAPSYIHRGAVTQV